MWFLGGAPPDSPQAPQLREVVAPQRGRIARCGDEGGPRPGHPRRASPGEGGLEIEANCLGVLGVTSPLQFSRGDPGRDGPRRFSAFCEGTSPTHQPLSRKALGGIWGAEPECQMAKPIRLRPPGACERMGRLFYGRSSGNVGVFAWVRGTRERSIRGRRFARAPKAARP